jgi:hypothetical protein
MAIFGTKAEYAKHRGCSKAYLSKPDVAERLEAATERDPADGKWKINFDKANEILAATSDPARAKPAPASEVAPESNTPGFHDIKTRREELKFTSDLIELQRQLGNTLDRQKTVDACTWWGKSVMDALKARNRRMGEILSTLNDPREIRAALDKSDYETFRSLSDDFRRKLSLPDPADDLADRGAG